MIRSMTGFGRGSASADDWTVVVTLKTVNHRYLEPVIRGLEERPELELRCRWLLEEEFARGRIDLQVELEHHGGRELRYDPVAARNYYTLLRRLATELGLPDRVRLEHLLALRGFLQEEEPDYDLWPLLEEALREAIRGVQEMRAREGEELRKVLEGYLEELEREVAVVGERAPAVVAYYREQLQKRAEELLAREVDRERLEEEVVLFATKADITEEVARLRSHLAGAREALSRAGPEPVGQVLDFLAQEMNREVNTIAAKARDAEIARQVVAMKALIERFREQVRNIE